MSINLMQELVYETDSLESFERMLTAAAHCAFKDKPPGEYTALHAKGEKPYLWDDGKNYHFDRKPVVVPVVGWGHEARYYLAEPKRTYGGATVLELFKSHLNLDDAAAEACRLHEQKHKPTPSRLWLATLADYKSDMKDTDLEFSNIQEMIDYIMVVIKDRKERFKDEFLRTCGTGFNSWFNSNDGDVDVGYRLHRRPNGGWNNLDVSLVHVYYGK